MLQTTGQWRALSNGVRHSSMASTGDKWRLQAVSQAPGPNSGITGQCGVVLGVIPGEVGQSQADSLLPRPAVDVAYPPADGGLILVVVEVVKGGLFTDRFTS
jgi:hypothetical protein